MFCVECGKEDVETVHGVCLDCFLKGRKLLTLPHHVDLQRCTNCEEFSIGDRWLKISQTEAIEEIAISALSLITEGKLLSVGALAEEQDERTFKVSIDADMDVLGVTVNDTADTIVRLKNTVCKRCSRQLGNYYEATMQIRSGDKNLPDNLRDEVVRLVRDTVETQSETNRQLFITRVEEVSGGVDILLSSISLGKSLSKMLVDTYGADAKDSSTLVGMTADGQDMYRVTYLIRLPAYHVGDVVLHEGRPYLLSGISKSGGKLISLENFQEMNVRRSALPAMKIADKSEDLREAVVVSTSDTEIQVLHPSNYSTVSVRIPTGAQIGETVRVTDVDDALFFVP